MKCASRSVCVYMCLVGRELAYIYACSEKRRGERRERKRGDETLVRSDRAPYEFYTCYATMYTIEVVPRVSSVYYI